MTPIATETHPDLIRMLTPFQSAQWWDVIRLRDALPELDPHVLLHAGPPYTDGAQLPMPVLQAAAQALVFEGIAPDLATALPHVTSGEYRLAPAQDHGVVTPLAQVVSPRMPMAAVRLGEVTRYAPLLEGGVPSLRFGSTEPNCVTSLHAISHMGLSTLAPCLHRSPLPIVPWLQEALSRGDDCHSRTGIANQAMVQALTVAYPSLESDVLSTLATNPNFVLTLIMAASACVLAAQDGGIKAVGGNGLTFGIRTEALDHWITTPATAPIGSAVPGREATPVLGAIGDSPVIDFCGLGGQALICAPALLKLWQTQLPGDASTRAEQVLDEQTGLVSAARIAASLVSPIVHLAMVDADGVHGLAGRGFYEPPVSLFHASQSSQAQTRA